MKFTIQGRLPSLNEAFNDARRNKYIEAKTRNQYEQLVIYSAKQGLRKWKPTGAVILHYHFFEPNAKRDKDNIAGYAMKLIQDSLVKAGYLSGDGWKEILNFDFKWSVDKKRPRIEVEIEEANKLNIYDIEELHENCTVQILRNSVNGDISVGWWENERSEE